MSWAESRVSGQRSLDVPGCSWYTKTCTARGGIKDFNLPDRVSGALKILPDISKIYRTFPKSWHIYLVAYNFFMNHPCDIIQTLNNINIWFKKRQFIFQRSNLWIRINGSYAGFFLAFSRAFKWYFDVSCDFIRSIFVGGVPSINVLCWTVSLGYLCAWSRHTEQNISPSSYFNQGRFTFHAVLNCLSFFGSTSLLE